MSIDRKNRLKTLFAFAVVTHLLISACGSDTQDYGPIVGKWKYEGQVMTMDDGSRKTIPYTGEAAAGVFDLELFGDGTYVDPKEDIRGSFAILDGNHVQFKIIEAKRLPSGLSYTNEFNVSHDKLTLSITRNPPGIRRIDIVYAKAPASTQTQTGSEIELQATVHQDIYTSFGSNPDVSPYAYEVLVTLTNKSKAPLEFDTIEGVFLPEQGRPLSNRTHPYDETKKDSTDGYSGGDLKSAQIAPGESEKFRFTTNGYTFKLLRGTGNAPLRFGFTIALKRKIVYGPVVGDLPPLDKLPIRVKDQQPVPLKLSKPDPAKIYDEVDRKRRGN